MATKELTFTEKLYDLVYRCEMIARAYLGIGRAWIKNGGAVPEVYFFPERPLHFHALYSILPGLGLRSTTKNPDRALLRIRFHDTTVSEGEGLESAAHSGPIINGDCTDIRKSRVEEVFRSVFGYGTNIDPESYTGVCVEKSDSNAVHDGRIIQCPVQPRKGCVYQKLIDTQIGDEVVDIRTMIMGDTIPFVAYRYKSKDDRFNNTKHSSIEKTADVFSDAEQKSILKFCKHIGMEYGEVDILRDKESGLIYIVDANNTPAGAHPGRYMPRKQYAHYIRAQREGFRKAFLSGFHACLISSFGEAFFSGVAHASMTL